MENEEKPGKCQRERPAKRWIDAPGHATVGE
jgi:hypothetical protein